MLKFFYKPLFLLMDRLNFFYYFFLSVFFVVLFFYFLFYLGFFFQSDFFSFFFNFFFDIEILKFSSFHADNFISQFFIYNLIIGQVIIMLRVLL